MHWPPIASPGAQQPGRLYFLVYTANTCFRRAARKSQQLRTNPGAQQPRAQNNAPTLVHSNQGLTSPETGSWTARQRSCGGNPTTPAASTPALISHPAALAEGPASAAARAHGEDPRGTWAGTAGEALFPCGRRRRLAQGCWRLLRPLRRICLRGGVAAQNLCPVRPGNALSVRTPDYVAKILLSHGSRRNDSTAATPGTHPQDP